MIDQPMFILLMDVSHDDVYDPLAAIINKETFFEIISRKYEESFLSVTHIVIYVTCFNYLTKKKRQIFCLVVCQTICQAIMDGS